MKLNRYEKNPLISPDINSDWQSLSTTNPGVWYDKDNGIATMLYRAAGDDDKHVIRFGMAISRDGLNFHRVSNDPIFLPSDSFSDAGCVEDPRIVKYGEYYFITYAARANGAGKYWLKREERKWLSPEYPKDFPFLYRSNPTASYLAITKDFKTFIRAGRLTNPTVDDRDVILFPEKINGKYFMLHRPMTVFGGPVAGLRTPTIWISSGDDLLNMTDSQPLCLPQFTWEEKKIGGSTPPLKTPKGWLVLYHGVSGELASSRYCVSSMLLDLDDPRKVLHRSSRTILEPQLDYEWNGCYQGGCVFPCGNIVIGSTLFVYYGAGDKYCCVATCDFNELVEFTAQFDADGIETRQICLVS